MFSRRGRRSHAKWTGRRHPGTMPRMAASRAPQSPAAKATALRRPLGALVAAAAGRIARARARLRPADVRRKAVGDFVTAIDLRTEAELRRGLRALLPDAGFLGEETAPAALDADWIWVVDPVDGTSNFARGLPHFAVSVALLHRGQPLLGAIHCAPEEALYTAVRGGGARRNGRAVRAGRARFDDGAMVGCQWFRGCADMTFLARLQSRGARIRTLGSSVTQLADVVMGRLDANVQQQGRIWDIAAAGLVACEAGLRFTDWSGAPVMPFADLRIGHTATVAATPAVHRQVLALLAPFV